MAALFSQNPRTGSDPVAIAVLDADGNGLADVAVANSSDNTVSLLVGLGGGSFAASIDFAVDGSPVAMTSGDVDGDGRTDLVVTGNDGTISLLRAMGRGDFADAIVVATDVGTVAPTLGDIDGDRHLDLVAVSPTQQLRVLGGDPTWENLRELTTLSLSGPPISIVAGDLDRDGRLDLAVARRDAPGVPDDQRRDGVSVFLNAGSGRFQQGVEYRAGIKPTSITIADLAGDAGVDIIVTNETPDLVNVLIGTDGRSFGRPTEYAVGKGPQRAVADDFNGDAIPDIVTVNAFQDNVSFLDGQGAADFGPAVDFTVGVFTTPLDIAVADFDGDGRLDLMTANFDTGDLSLLVNTSDHPVIPGDADGNRQLTSTDIDRIIAEIFDGDGDSPFDTRYGFTANVGTVVNANGDPRVSCADVVAVLRALGR